MSDLFGNHIVGFPIYIFVGTDGEGADRPKRRYNRRFQRRRRQPRRDRDSTGEGEGDMKKEDGSEKEGLYGALVVNLLSVASV